MGIFFDSPASFYEMDPLSLTMYGELTNKEKEKKEEEKKNKEPENNNESFNWGNLLYGLIFLFVCCVYTYCKESCKKSGDSMYLTAIRVEASSNYYD